MNESIHEKRLALLVGADNGPGMEIVNDFLSYGNQSIVVFNDEATLKKMQKIWALENKRPLCMVGDMTLSTDRDKICKTLKGLGGQLQLIVNNLKPNIRKKMPVDINGGVNYILDMNIFGPLEITKMCFPYLSVGLHVTVINIAPILGEGMTPSNGPFRISKSAVSEITGKMVDEWGRYIKRTNSNDEWYLNAPIEPLVIKDNNGPKFILSNTSFIKISKHTRMASAVPNQFLERSHFG
tara:strand:+ start:5895 stop:6611 length:717 start_codon:yes stop_codon:yes gene_type:complete